MTSAGIFFGLLFSWPTGESTYSFCAHQRERISILGSPERAHIYMLKFINRILSANLRISFTKSFMDRINLFLAEKLSQQKRFVYFEHFLLLFILLLRLLRTLLLPLPLLLPLLFLLLLLKQQQRFLPFSTKHNNNEFGFAGGGTYCAGHKWNRPVKREINLNFKRSSDIEC